MVKNGSKRRSSTASRNRTAAVFHIDARESIGGRAYAQADDAPGGDASTAFITRFISACCRRASSYSAATSSGASIRKATPEAEAWARQALTT